MHPAILFGRSILLHTLRMEEAMPSFGYATIGWLLFTTILWIGHVEEEIVNYFLVVSGILAILAVAESLWKIAEAFSKKKGK